MCATPGEIERGVAAFARSSNGGLILTGGNRAILDRDLIVTLAAQHKRVGAPLVFDRIGNGGKGDIARTAAFGRK
jgi:hypothetical protein